VINQNYEYKDLYIFAFVIDGLLFPNKLDRLIFPNKKVFREKSIIYRFEK